VDNQRQRSFGARGFRVAVSAVAAVVVLAGGAYLFGSRLRADSSASVARSPLGSSLVVVPASRADFSIYMNNSAVSARAEQAALAALSPSESQADFSTYMSNSAVRTRAEQASLAALSPSESQADFSIYMSNSAVRARAEQAAQAALSPSESVADFSIYMDNSAVSARARQASLAAPGNNY